MDDIFAIPDCTPDHVPAYFIDDPIPHDEVPKYSPAEELRILNEQVTKSQGFDIDEIDFTNFRCNFNYFPISLDGNKFVMPPETTRQLVDRLSQKSLEGYNERKGTNYEFVNVIKANLRSTSSPTETYFITFEGKDPSDDQPKLFQAKVCYFYYHPPEYNSCDLKPDEKPQKKVHSIKTPEKEDVKKLRLT